MVDLKARAGKIRLVLTDIDGVWTDGGVYYSAQGEELKRFSIRDGMGVERLRKHAGIETAIITGERSESVRKRAEKLGIRELHLGIQKKLEVVESLALKFDLPMEKLAYLGDDVNDLGPLSAVGLAGCPRDAVEEVVKAVHWVSSCPGGHGAFRDFAEFILKAQLGSSEVSQTRQ